MGMDFHIVEQGTGVSILQALDVYRLYVATSLSFSAGGNLPKYSCHASPTEFLNPCRICQYDRSPYTMKHVIIKRPLRQEVALAATNDERELFMYRKQLLTTDMTRWPTILCECSYLAEDLLEVVWRVAP